MRQLSVYFFALAPWRFRRSGHLGSETTCKQKALQLAQQDLEGSATLVRGALPRIRLEQAQLDVADAQDDAILARTLYGDLPAKDVTEQWIDEMVAAAQRRVERQQERVDQAREAGDRWRHRAVLSRRLRTELAMRRTNLDLAQSARPLIGELAALAKLEQSMRKSRRPRASTIRDFLTQGMEHYRRRRGFHESRDLKPLELAFAKKFDRPLPISADGETDFHRALGFDHRGRVDVAINPNASKASGCATILESRHSLLRLYARHGRQSHRRAYPHRTRQHSPASRRLADGSGPARLPHR